MTLDEQFLKYKLEKIKNEDIFKDQDSGTKKRIRKANSEKAKKEANAIHSYLTGIDTIQPWNKNRSFISDDGIPGNLTISDNGKLDIVQVEGRGRGRKSILKSRQLKIFKKIFDSLNIIFKRGSLSIGGNLSVEKDVEIGGNLIVFSGRRGAKKGTITFQGNYIFDGTLEVKKNATIRNHLFVSKNVVSENLTVNSDFLAEQGVFNKELTVYGKTTMEQDVSVSRNLDVEGELSVGELSVEELSVEELSVGESIADVNGYTYLPNGILIQWGIDTSDVDGSHTITFPIPFPNNCFSVVVNHKLTGGWNTDAKYGYPITAASYDTNGFVINRNDAASATINLNYMAIGN
jgi:hypothetical protein